LFSEVIDLRLQSVELFLGRIVPGPHDARLHWYIGDVEEGDSFGFGEPVGTMMPGDEITRFRQFPPSVDRDASRPVLRFRDAARVMWQVDKNGDLRELPPLAP